MEASRVRQEVRATPMRKVLRVLCTVSTVTYGVTTEMDGARKNLPKPKEKIRRDGLLSKRKARRVLTVVKGAIKDGTMPQRLKRTERSLPKEVVVSLRLRGRSSALKGRTARPSLTMGRVRNTTSGQILQYCARSMRSTRPQRNPKKTSDGCKRSSN